MRRLFAGYALVGVLAAAAPVSAAEVAGLYEAEVPVSSQGAVERIAASHAGLEEVLVKVTGGSEVLQRPQIKALLDQAEQWVQRYQYRAAPPAPAQVDGVAMAPGQLLWLAFDRQFINQRLAEAGVPVWGMNRPRTLIWLAEEKDGARYLVGGDNSPAVQQAVSDQAQHRGLPLTLPLLDLQDQNNLSAADVWGDFPEVIAKASERYQPEALLVGRVYRSPLGQWRGHWTLYHRGATTTWDSAPGTENDAIAAGIAGASDQFARRYALNLTAEAANSMTLTIENVTSLADYARALRYLKSLDPVAAVQILRVEGEAVSYRLKVRGEIQAVVRSIGWGTALVSAAGQDASVADDRGKAVAAAEDYHYRMAQ